MSDIVMCFCSHVCSGKTALVLSLCRHLRDTYNVCVVTNDIFTKEDCEFLTRNEALPAERISCLGDPSVNYALTCARMQAVTAVYL